MQELPTEMKERLRNHIKELDREIDRYHSRLVGLRGSMPTIATSADKISGFFSSLASYTALGHGYVISRNTLVQILPELGLEQRANPFAEVFPELMKK